ncbi:ECF-type sigma factor, partial [Rubrivirga sp.]|uniref:ECF-type sigma factor n=1 Tax=Rubrivirga sp. TaxID=1885344 RepID=UPI003C76793D
VREDPDAHMGRVHREMNQVVIARARSRNRQKRWGSAARVTLDDDRLSGGAEAQPEASVHRALDLADALDRLGRVSPRLREVVRLRFEVGLTVGQVSATMEVPRRTVERDLTKARGLLGVLLRAEPPLD